MPMIEIREAATDDALRLAELRWEFRSGKAEPIEDHDTFVARCAGWIRAQLTTRLQWRAWVATENGAVVGQVWVHVIQKLPNPAAERERHMYLSNLYVTPSARGGAGTRLLETALAWAAAEAIDRVILWPTARSRPLYLRHGFTEAVSFLELALPDEE
jgi:GNAT superfamily N-acetyltransferase